MRKPSSPPVIEGYLSPERIGSGGYADVFLYEQASTSQKVAIKVITPREGMSAASQADFISEANLMAKVSSHPYIAHIFNSGVASDGRPYLVMQYYPSGNYQERAKNAEIGIDEALRVGVQIASAIETAHRAGILHRDIKPANILIDDFGNPGLIDFGIASGQGPDHGPDGVSIPWAPPEAINGLRTDTRSDVYSLAATIYTLLEGRSPFEVPGGDNSELALMARIDHDPMPPLSHPSATHLLELTLAQAMAKDPQQRPRTAEEFAIALNAVEAELRLAPTKLGLKQDLVERSRRDEDEDKTRAKGITKIEAQGPVQLIDGVDPRPSAGPSVATRERFGMLEEPAADATRLRPKEREDAGDAVEDVSVARKLYIGAGAVAAVVVIATALVLAGGGGGRDSIDDGAESNVDIYEVNDGIDSPVAVSPPAVGEISVSDNGNGTFTYSWDAPLDGLTYAVTPDGSTTAEQIDVTSYETHATCIQVEAIGDSGFISAATIGCVSE